MNAIEVDDTELVEHVVEKLKLLSRRKTLEFTLLVGRLIVESLYKGDIGRVRLRGPKEASFRKLAEHPELPLSAVSLWRCVATYELVQRMPELLDAEHLSATHLRVVLRLPPDRQRELLRLAETEQWTSQRLEIEVQGHTPCDQHGRGVVTRRVDRALRALDGALAQLDADARLEHREMEHLHASIHGARRKLEECAARLDRLRSDKS